MLHGDDKAREMARSLLPAKNRHTARKARAELSRRTRRSVRTRMALLEYDVDAADDRADLHEDSTREMRRLVTWRRDSDKVNPFRRWARTVTREVPRDERLEHVRGVLPEGLIGEHALSHLRWDAHFETTADREQREARRWRGQLRDAPLERGLSAQLLRRLLQLPDGQRAFNEHLKRACARQWSYVRGHDGRRHVVWQGLEPIRLLLGEHDVLPFLDTFLRRWQLGPSRKDVTPAPPEAVSAAQEFLRVFHAQRGDLPATLAALPSPPGAEKRKGPVRP
ncbi:hypothetical protein [Pyxidicoccus xibeiensis]|uniref:hypothetical protein n=1 Tax=Pyxidicoccus xibeiensis TaxID=2906759 RepID=UPI0020A6FA65|nr:hypothetical protein [Pyxidicoccus xibeiensis]MCP3139577.1 hypothetical protein [Pyxidicoccus xibeiensis]